MQKMVNDFIEMTLNFPHLYNAAIYDEVDISHYCEDNLNRTQMRTLLLVDFYSGSPMTEISRRLELEKGSFTPVARKLMKLGYIRGSCSPRDKRKTILKLTPKGQAFTFWLRLELVREWGIRLSALSPEDQQKLTHHLSELYRLLKKVNRRNAGNISLS